MSSEASTPGSAPRSMSSRLLTMKFMQRAAASSPAASSPATPDEPSPKRLKKNSDSPSRPSTNVDALADQRAIRAAVDAEEAKRQAALDRQAAEAGDTRWVLSFEGQENSTAAPSHALRVVQAGYANLDVPIPLHSKPTDEENLPDEPAMIGRRSWGKFNKDLEKQLDPPLEDSEDSDSEDDDNEESSESSSDEDDPTSELIKASREEVAQRVKAERKAKKLAEKAQAQELSKKRKKKEVKLNTNMTSLTGRQDRPDAVGGCFRCGGPHKKIDCPQPNQKRGYQGGENGPMRKARKVK